MTAGRVRLRPTMAVLALLALVASGCGDANGTTTLDEPTTTPTTGAEPTTTTTTAPPSTTERSTTTTEQATTTTERATTTTARATTTTEQATTTTEPLVDDVVAAGTFDFASGVDPEIRVMASVGTDPNDPNSFVPAGDGDQPSFQAAQFWIRFTVQNRDDLGFVTSVEVGGDAPIGTAGCSDLPELAPLATGTCTIGPFPSPSGGGQASFFATGLGERQVYNQQYFSPPLRSPGYDGAPTSFRLIYETPSSAGLLVEGRAGGTAIDVDLPELQATISVDCGASPGSGGPLPLVAYAIVTFDGGGNTTGGCSSIPPTEELFYFTDGVSDSVVNLPSS